MKLFSLTDFEIQTNEPYRERNKKTAWISLFHAVSFQGSIYTISALPRYWLVETCTGSVADRKKR